MVATIQWCGYAFLDNFGGYVVIIPACKLNFTFFLQCTAAICRWLYFNLLN